MVGATRLPVESAPSSAIWFSSPWPSSGAATSCPRLSNPKLQIILVAVGVAVLFPVGIYFLVLAVKDPRRAFNSARRRWSEGPIPARLAGEAAKAPP